MNARQAARAAAKRIEEMERVNILMSRDIRGYNTVILKMIEGESPCPYCEEFEECQLEARGNKGCSEWWLKFWEGTPDEEAEKTEQPENQVQHMEEQ